MTPFTYLVLSVASYRAARAVAIDSITQPLRDWAEFSGNKFIDGLLHCGYCVGFWLSGLTYLVYVAAVDDHLKGTSMLEHGINWWAIAGLQALLIAVDTFFLREAPPHG